MRIYRMDCHVCSRRLGIGLANFVGFDVNFMDSLPGILILLGISLVAVLVSKIVPLKLPIIATARLSDFWLRVRSAR